MRKEFDIAPLGRATLLGLWLPILAAITLVIGLAWMSSQPGVLWITLPFIALLAVGLTWASHRRSIAIENRELRITAALYRKQVPVEALDLDHARILSLDEHTDLRPMVKTRGFNLPGLAAGHYRMRNFAKAFCLVTDHSRVLALPMRDGPLLLLSAEKPRDLLDTLRELAASGHRR